jgi:hypothetical protein
VTSTYLELRHVMVSVRGGSQGVVDELLAVQRRRIALLVPHFLAAQLIVASTDRRRRRGWCRGEALGLRVYAAAGGAGLHGEAGVARAAAGRPGHLWLRQQVFAAAALRAAQLGSAVQRVRSRSMSVARKALSAEPGAGREHA